MSRTMVKILFFSSLVLFHLVSVFRNKQQKCQFYWNSNLML